jgi:ubiquinone/menaquinone biosynthesis C-methylase UbiE
MKTSSDEKNIYNQEAEQYDRLIACEDYQGNLISAIQSVLPLDNLRAVDLGTGTGRLARLLATHLASIIGFDTSASMLKVARRELSVNKAANWLLGQADHRCLPMASHSVDLVISGWSICYLSVWYPRTWRVELEMALAEMLRVLRQHGRILLIETLGTGSSSPKPPIQLEPYFSWLAEKGFVNTWLRTDYSFKDRSEADELTRFFFGDEMCERIIECPFGVILPECTGLWWSGNLCEWLMEN